MSERARREAERKRRQAEINKRRRATSAKKRKQIRKQAESRVVRTYPDHCALSLSKKERIRLLGEYGTVLETKPGKVFKAGKHGMSYLYVYGNTYIQQPAYCY